MNRVEEEVERETSTTTTSNTAPTDADTKEFATSDMIIPPMAGGFSTGRGKKVTPSEASIHSKLYFRIINSDYV